MTTFLAFVGAIVCLLALIVFFVMATRITEIVRILRRLEMNSTTIRAAIERQAMRVDPKGMTDEEKARAYDRGQKQ
jgi:predicted aspartyl protease